MYYLLDNLYFRPKSSAYISFANKCIHFSNIKLTIIEIL